MSNRNGMLTYMYKFIHRMLNFPSQQRKIENIKIYSFRSTANPLRCINQLDRWILHYTKRAIYMSPDI